MTTRKDHLVQLLAGLGSWTPNEDKVEHAVALLAEIEKVCPEEPADPVNAYLQQSAAAIEATARADERERCAKIAESLELKDYEDKWIRSAIASNIRRGGQ